ncbi:MAG: hypothetical protein ACO3O7_08365 [Ilumatobacteraceae bacterium]
MSTWTTQQQFEAMMRWSRSQSGLEAAIRLARKYGISEDSHDLVAMTTEKLTAAFSRRTERLPNVVSDEGAIRYAYRSMANLAIDLARRQRSESNALVSLARITPVPHGPDQSVTSQVFIEELFTALHQVTSNGFTCSACNDRVTYAAATEVLHLALLEGSDAAVGETWFDDVIYSVVDRYEGGMSKSSAAQRQRRSRCKRCVMELLQASLAHMGVRRG